MAPIDLIDLFAKTNVIHSNEPEQVNLKFMPAKQNTSFGKKSMTMNY